MEKKTNLNNSQRKMLDEIYTEQFNKKSELILAERVRQYKQLVDKVLKSESTKNPLKSVLSAIEHARKAVSATKEYCRTRGLKIDNAYDLSREKQCIQIEAYSGYVHPELESHLSKTREIETDLAQKKKEIRARIYGMDTTYEEVDADISKYIANVK